MVTRSARRAGQELGEPNEASKRLVQRWESGTSRTPRGVYARALERVTGRPVEALGFMLPVPMARVRADGTGGYDMDTAGTGASVVVGAQVAAQAVEETFSGVWLSRYEFYSSSRSETYEAKHYVVVVQHGNRLTAQSLPGASTNPDSPLALDLTVDRNVVTGTWVEPTGRRMAGKWVGFGKDFDVNTGPWELRLVDRSTSKAALERYGRVPE
ncbi:XRE family transcriptional regulator [Streptomyces sp. NPDC088757]|uniref:XRE family transcriptional regulator n=1 Tax=Streptomyces sp. NPDC088757 TaxID=3365889 RepID=UPI00381309BB